MKRIVLLPLFLCAFISLHAQIEEDFSPFPSGWILSQGAGFNMINGNNLVVTPGVGGNNPSVIGTPPVNKTSNTIKVCLDIWAYQSNLTTQVPFPCNSYMDVLFSSAAVTDAKNADDAGLLYARVDNHPLPTNGGTTCFTFTLPENVTASDFKVFLSFHADCNQGGIKYVIDNISISGVDDICTDGCPPTALNDAFVRTQPTELSFDAVLFGSNINFPAPPPGYAADATGTDGDPNDAFDHLRWELVSGPANGAVVVNADGTCTITRNDQTVTELSFVYRLCDDGADDDFATGGDNFCDEATVIVSWPAPSTLPVSMGYFTGTRNGSVVTLKWTTSFESNNTGFEVQRSIAGGEYRTVGFVKTKAVDGNSQAALQYEYTESNAVQTTSMYRLMQIDKDGTRKRYTTRAVPGMDAGRESMVVYPNPSRNGAVNLSFSNISVRQITVSNMSGKVIRSYNNVRSNGLTINELQPGMYVLVITDMESNARRVEKIVVTKQ